MTDIKIGVLGCGSIAEIAHFPAIDGREGVRLIATCDVNPESAEDSAKRWGAEQWFTDYHEMYEKSKIDAVIIATPNNVHRNQAVAAAKAGIHIVVEKPMAVTNFEAWDIVNACKEAGVKLMV